MRDGAARGRRPVLRSAVDEGLRQRLRARPAGDGAHGLPSRFPRGVQAAAERRVGARRLPTHVARGIPSRSSESSKAPSGTGARRSRTRLSLSGLVTRERAVEALAAIGRDATVRADAAPPDRLTGIEQPDAGHRTAAGSAIPGATGAGSGPRRNPAEATAAIAAPNSCDASPVSSTAPTAGWVPRPARGGRQDLALHEQRQRSHGKPRHLGVIEHDRHVADRAVVADRQEPEDLKTRSSKRWFWMTTPELARRSRRSPPGPIRRIGRSRGKVCAPIRQPMRRRNGAANGVPSSGLSTGADHRLIGAVHHLVEPDVHGPQRLDLRLKVPITALVQRAERHNAIAPSRPPPDGASPAWATGPSRTKARPP